MSTDRSDLTMPCSTLLLSGMFRKTARDPAKRVRAWSDLVALSRIGKRCLAAVWTAMAIFVGAIFPGGAQASPSDTAFAGNAPPMMKSIYLTRRKASFTHDQFVKRWRWHGALAMSKGMFENIPTYVQAEILQPSPLAGTTQDYDGLAYIRTREHPLQQREIDELRDMEKDELETFEGIIRPRIITVDEEIVKPGPNGGATAFLFFRDVKAAKKLAEGYRGDAFTRVLLDVRRHGPGLEAISALIPYQAVVEVSAAGTDALVRLLGSAKTAPWRAADLAAITRETVMWERPLAP